MFNPSKEETLLAVREISKVETTDVEMMTLNDVTQDLTFVSFTPQPHSADRSKSERKTQLELIKDVCAMFFKCLLMMRKLKHGNDGMLVGTHIPFRSEYLHRAPSLEPASGDRITTADIASTVSPRSRAASRSRSTTMEFVAVQKPALVALGLKSV